MNAISKIDARISPKIIVRSAYRPDFEVIITMLFYQMHPEQALFELDHNKSAAEIAGAIDEDRALVVTRNNMIIATAAYMETSSWYSNELFYGDIWFYVPPEYRKSRCAIMLKNEMIRRTRPKKLIIGVVGKTLAGERLFGHGLTPCGHLFLKEDR